MTATNMRRSIRRGTPEKSKRTGVCGGMASTKQMLEAILKLPGGTLKRGDQAAMEDMWDQVHRYGKLSAKQNAWIQKIFLENKLDRSDRKPTVPVRTAKVQVGYFEDPKFTQPIRVSTLAEFENLCPHFPKGSPSWQRAAAFLRDAGHIIELRPPKTPEKKGS